MIPYGRQSIDEEDIRAVVEVLRSDWLTTGPKVHEFEQHFSQFIGVREAVAVSSGTAALHAAVYALGIGAGDEVIVPAMTFAATANCVVFQQATPVFVDVTPDTLLINPEKIEERITPRTKAIISVDYAGQPCDYDALKSIADKHQLSLIDDACHALGARYKGKNIGSLADLTTFSFHPVKHITTGEGGMVVTDDPDLAARMRLFRNHGISTDHRQRAEKGTWFYEMTDLGYNYRISDIQCSLGLSQLRKLPVWICRRRGIAMRYDRAFEDVPTIEPLRVSPEVYHAYHLYVVQLLEERIKRDRSAIFTAFREEGIGVNVHYIPVHLHPYYRERFGYREGECPVAEMAYQGLISLPMYHGMGDEDIEAVIEGTRKVMSRYGG